VDCFLVALPFNLPGKGGPTGSYANASAALGVTGSSSPPTLSRSYNPYRRYFEVNYKMDFLQEINKEIQTK
jgi:hypothetical protein